MELPKNEATFDFKEVGETTLKEYDGMFTVRCVLNIAQKHNLELEKNRLLADFINPTDGLASIAIIIANLRAKVISGPNWWEQSQGGLTLIDEDIVVKLFNKVKAKEVEWRDSVRSKALEKIKEDTPEGNAPPESKS
jgi:hypothetical protein